MIGAQHDPTNGRLEELYPHHFSVIISQGEVRLRPTSSHAELWLRVERRVELTMDDVVRLGQRRLCLTRTDQLLPKDFLAPTSHVPLSQASLWSLLVLDPAGQLEALYPLREGVTRLGRALADINLPDRSLNLSHAALWVEEAHVTLVDLGSESGVWHLAKEEVSLTHNMVFSAGHTLFVAR